MVTCATCGNLIADYGKVEPIQTDDGRVFCSVECQDDYPG
jgi:hypothetical protein